MKTGQMQKRHNVLLQFSIQLHVQVHQVQSNFTVSLQAQEEACWT